MYAHVFVGGTFDHLHKGHEAVLHRAFHDGDFVTIGITSDAFISQYKPGKGISPFEERKAAVEAYRAREGLHKHYQVVPIDDPYEPAASGGFDAIIVTMQNSQTGREINAKREEKGLLPLAFIEVDLLPAQDGDPISSTHIRDGSVDRAGKLTVPDALRPELKSPLGQVLQPDEALAFWHSLKNKTIVTVGDATSFKAVESGVFPDLVIIDHKEKREDAKTNVEQLLPSEYVTQKVQSGPGFIAKEAITMLSGWGSDRKKTALVVDGEEDLLVLPAILFAPLESHVYYGQPDVGIVEVIVTPEVKTKVTDLLAKFEKK